MRRMRRIGRKRRKTRIDETEENAEAAEVKKGSSRRSQATGDWRWLGKVGLGRNAVGVNVVLFCSFRMCVEFVVFEYCSVCSDKK